MHGDESRSGGRDADAHRRDATPVRHEAPATLDDGDRPRRGRAALAVAPLLAIGLFDLVLLLGWGVDPLWGFLILPPILFVCAIAWIAFSTGFARDRTGE